MVTNPSPPRGTGERTATNLTDGNAACTITGAKSEVAITNPIMGREKRRIKHLQLFSVTALREHMLTVLPERNHHGRRSRTARCNDSNFVTSASNLLGATKGFEDSTSILEVTMRWSVNCPITSSAG